MPCQVSSQYLASSSCSTNCRPCLRQARCHRQTHLCLPHANADPRTLSLLCDSSRTRLKASRTSDDTTICVLRFHPAFAYAFRKALRAVPVPPDVPFTIVPSWRNALPSTMSVVGKANRHNASSTMFNNQGIPHLGVVEGGKVVVVVPPSSNKYSPVTNVTIMSPNFLDTLFNNLNS